MASRAVDVGMLGFKISGVSFVLIGFGPSVARFHPERENSFFIQLSILRTRRSRTHCRRETCAQKFETLARFHPPAGLTVTNQTEPTKIQQRMNCP